MSPSKKTSRASVAPTFLQAPAQPTDATAFDVWLYDGARQPMPAGTNVKVRLVELKDGREPRSTLEDLSSPRVRIVGLEDYDETLARYSVLVSAAGYHGAGFYPLHAHRGYSERVDLMLIPKGYRLDFGSAGWEALKTTSPVLRRLLEADAPSPSAACDRYTRLPAERGEACLAALLNITTAMGQIQLRECTLLDRLQAFVWDDPKHPMKQDRFFAWAATGLDDELRAARNEWKPEPHPEWYHEGATCSYKNTAFGEANVQVTFHDETHSETGWELVELDIDYFRDDGEHIMLEVLPNTVTGSLTDPVVVYALRWIACRESGRPNFSPPYTIVSA